jgi:hypothetical protein
MSIAIETFECSETAAEPIEASEEAIRLLEELGLSGQQELVRPKAEKPAARCPYREMTQEEFFAYSVLCPKKVNITKYDASPIPLRVLQVAAHANSLEIFHELEVWDRENVELKDPVLVAYGKGDSWNRKRYILARWGEVLETFSVLLKRAVDAKREQLVAEAKAAAADIAAKQTTIPAMTAAELIKAGPRARLELAMHTF